MKSIGVSFDETAGAIKPLHGVNNGPITFGGLGNVSHYYREIGVPFVRIHDPNWPNPREVDVPQIFRNPEADPDKPENYDFSRTDEYLRSIAETGAKIVYRLGVSIEHTRKKYYTQPPKDFARWGRVCANIVRHYNQGWAGGFHHDIRHWEIWNEPDLHDHMWTGTFEEYMAMYAAAAGAIKAVDASLKVGGYAAASALVPREDFDPRRFLEICRERRLPLDFYSWHMYAIRQSPRAIGDTARAVRKMLDEQGYSGIESHLNEWNIGIFRHAPGQEYLRGEGYERASNQVGASFAAGTLMLLQDAGVDVANYYDAQPTNWFCGLFNLYGMPTKTYQAFKAFSTLLAYPQRVGVHCNPDDTEVACLAASDQAKNRGAVLLSKFGGGEVGEYRIELRGRLASEARTIQFLMLDQYRNLQTFRPRTEPVFAGDSITIDVELLEHAVLLVQLC